MIVEHKRPLARKRRPARWPLYDLPAHAQPKIIGKVDEQGRPLLSQLSSLSVAEVALAIADRLPPGPHMERLVHDFLNRVSRLVDGGGDAGPPSRCASHSSAPAVRTTRRRACPKARVRSPASAGRHYMAELQRPADRPHHPHGSRGRHLGRRLALHRRAARVRPNLGDGTYNHSGSLAIRASIAMGSHITYKLLYNDAVAMTGGQHPESNFSVAQITRQLAAEGVAKTIVVADEIERYASVADLAPGVEVKPRRELMAVQRALKATPGVTVLIYDQTCATEKRRRRKRGLMPAATRKVFINPLVCEGCGDCSRASNCVSIEPLETEFGRKRRIDQSTCNQDYSCLEGFCPSFVTLEGAEVAHAHQLPTLTADSTPLPTIPAFEGVKNIIFTGIGGTGVTTTASILAMAAHVDGMAASVVDMTGLAQKGGAVFSHVRIGAEETTPVGGRVPAASTHALIACDLLVAAGPEALALYAKDRTEAVGNADFQPTADLVFDRDARFDQSIDGTGASRARRRAPTAARPSRWPRRSSATPASPTPACAATPGRRA